MLLFDQVCGLAFYPTMVSYASLKVMDFYDDMRRFKFLLDVFICNILVVVVSCSCICYKSFSLIGGLGKL